MTSDFADKELKPGVSAIVCCHDSSKVIAPTIKALCRQLVPKEIEYEVILVDSNCKDAGGSGAPGEVVGEALPARPGDGGDDVLGWQVAATAATG